MFSEIYKELELFRRGPIINHHNKPLPPILKVLLEKYFEKNGMVFDSTCFFLKSEDGHRMYIRYNNKYNNDIYISIYTVNVLMEGKDLLCIIIPDEMLELSEKDQCINEYLYNIAGIVEIVLQYETKTITKDRSVFKELAVPLIYTTLVKKTFTDYDLDYKLICKEYNHFMSKANTDFLRDRFLCFNEDFFKHIVYLLEDYEPAIILDKYEEFIYWYLDCSFFMVDDILHDYRNYIIEKENQDGDKENV